MIGTVLGLTNAVTIAFAVALAFLFGHTISTLPLVQAGRVLAQRSAWCSPPTLSRSR
jgi:hypothetical protein